MYIGKRRYLDDSICVAEVYLENALSDEKAAVLLFQNGLYNQSLYFLIQSMEKQIKYKIAKKIDITNSYFANEIKKTMGHSLESSIHFLIQIYTGDNEILKQQMEHQLLELLLKSINFRGLHNNVRYPLYHMKYSNYSFLDISRDECQEIFEMLSRLKQYLSELDKRQF